jgi:hypothetical protein
MKDELREKIGSEEQSSGPILLSVCFCLVGCRNGCLLNQFLPLNFSVVGAWNYIENFQAFRHFIPVQMCVEK